MALRYSTVKLKWSCRRLSLYSALLLCRGCSFGDRECLKVVEIDNVACLIDQVGLTFSFCGKRKKIVFYFIFYIDVSKKKTRFLTFSSLKTNDISIFCCMRRKDK